MFNQEREDVVLIKKHMYMEGMKSLPSPDVFVETFIFKGFTDL